ncbi:YesL family protein [Metabacillus sp. Hm71]|uniref:YesL family protein n=1 Tax=Metabacillus sp. Hm71 TaxID=3450743 RepID=UPI003F425C36
MQEKSMIGGIYTVMEWISRFVYLQFLWAMFTVFGLIGLGFFPATFTMFAITRKWIHGQTDISLFPAFKQLYKKDFLKANAIGGIAIAFGFIAYFYLRFFQVQSGAASVVFFFLMFAVCLFYLMTLLFIAPVFVHYHLKVMQIFKISFMMAISYPFHVIAMFFILFCFGLLMQAIPGLLPFFSFSYLAFALMWIANSAIENKEGHISITVRNNKTEI